MSSLQSEIIAFLVAGGVGTAGTDLFDDGLRPAPDAQVAMKQYGGEAAALVHGTSGEAYEHPRFQVATRAATFDAARTKAMAVHALLVAVRNTSLSGTWYVAIRALQAPFPLERDANNRVVFVCNYQVEKAPSA